VLVLDFANGHEKESQNQEEIDEAKEKRQQENNTDEEDTNSQEGGEEEACLKDGARKKTTRKKQPGESRRSRAVPYPSERQASRSGEQSGDLQGLSRPEAADSESVNELLEEGNAFEADAVIGVEDAESSDEKEVRTHEVLEDDVPGEYLDEE